MDDSINDTHLMGGWEDLDKLIQVKHLLAFSKGHMSVT